MGRARLSKGTQHRDLRQTQVMKKGLRGRLLGARLTLGSALDDVNVSAYPRSAEVAGRWFARGARLRALRKDVKRNGVTLGQGNWVNLRDGDRIQFPSDSGPQEWSFSEGRRPGRPQPRARARPKPPPAAPTVKAKKR